MLIPPSALLVFFGMQLVDSELNRIHFYSMTLEVYDTSYISLLILIGLACVVEMFLFRHPPFTSALFSSNE